MPISAKTIGPTQLTNAAATLYTTPALTATTIQTVFFTNTDSADHTVNLSIGTDAVGTRIISDVTVKANGLLQITGLLFLTAAQFLQAFASTGSVVNVSVALLEQS